VFCCFNNPQKFTPEMFDIWMRLLQATEGSVLWLITGNAKATANLRLEAEQRGVAPERLIFAPKASVADHLARHRLADLCLDTLPYNAHTTASDALWAGLPVLTCLGEAFAGRVAASLLRAIGLDALITRTLGEYEALALRLARDPAYLATLKDTLNRNRDGSLLFDTQRATRHIETAYQTMADIARRNERPHSFKIERA
jgi:predicted O-linked N-acetylglucosamine transferase (SPINDLY family)